MFFPANWKRLLWESLRWMESHFWIDSITLLISFFAGFCHSFAAGWVLSMFKFFSMPQPFLLQMQGQCTSWSNYIFGCLQFAAEFVVDVNDEIRKGEVGHAGKTLGCRPLCACVCNVVVPGMVALSWDILQRLPKVLCVDKRMHTISINFIFSQFWVEWCWISFRVLIFIVCALMF